MIFSLLLNLLFLFLNLVVIEEIKNFLVTGINNKNPIKSVTNPGRISNNAANAMAAPEIIS